MDKKDLDAAIDEVAEKWSEVIASVVINAAVTVLAVLGAVKLVELLWK